MTINNADIDSIYTLYGFTLVDQNDDYRVYTYDQGYFHNAEILLYDSCTDESYKRIKESIEKTGYAVSMKRINDISNFEDDLFKGFFKASYARDRVKNEYDEYANKQTSRLGGMKYDYIKSSYTINGEIHTETDILKRITTLMTQKGKNLVILEAPAGFGKTCTSYEISKLLTSDETKIPMLMELSKNRRATIFRYVLLAEIDSKFHLPYELVVHQIRVGRIPLIIDGFDELLSRFDTKEDNTEDAITMLDTISGLLDGDSNACILLTSRKSSIFSGEEFESWIEKNLSTCAVSRIQILTPTISDWIEKDKREYFIKKGINLKNVQNPVLLSLLKYKPIEEFETSFRQESDILETYIQIMFKREQTRQFLLLDVPEQRDVMKRLSAVMVQLDITSASHEEIKTMLETAIESDLSNYLIKYKEYPDQDRVSNINEDSFLSKLANNAMLDRVKPVGNDIGFINEFIFGIFIGEAITSGYLNITDATGNYLNMAVSSFASEKIAEKDNLYNIITKSNVYLSTEQKLICGFNLKGAVTHDFVDEYIDNVVFNTSIEMLNDKYFYNCVFETCTFTGCTIASNLFEGCHFINCNFYDVNIIDTGIVEEASLFISCKNSDKMYECFGNNAKKTMVTPDEDSTNFTRTVLEQFWMPGSDHAEMRRSYRTLFKGIDPKFRKEVTAAINQLLDEHILTELIHCLELNKNKMRQIKEILGKNE